MTGDSHAAERAELAAERIRCGNLTEPGTGAGGLCPACCN